MVDNNQSFPNNNNGAITPSVLRAFNTNMIDSTVNQSQYTTDSGSWNAQIDALEQFSSSFTGSGGTINTGSFATTGSNNFIGNQFITGALLVSGSEIDFRMPTSRFQQGASSTFSGITDFNVTFIGDAKFNGDNLQVEGPDPQFQLRDTTAPFYPSYAMRSKDQQLQFIEGVGGYIMVDMTTSSVDVNTNINVSGSLTASLAQGFTYVGDANGRTTLVATSSFGSGGTINTGSFATTGSNSFVGEQSITGSVLISGSVFEVRTSGSIKFTPGADIQFLGNTVFTAPIRTTIVNVDNSGSNGFYGFNNEIDGRIYQDFSGSVNSRINAIVTGTGFATTGSNSFNGDQNITGSVQISSQLIFGTASLGPTIQTLSGNGLQVNAGESGSFSMRTLYGGTVATANLEAYDTFPSFNFGGKVSTKSGGGVDIVGYNGAVNITGSSLQMQGFTYPTTDGTNGQVLTTNGSKVLSFTTVSGGGGSTFTNPSVESISGSLLLTADTFTSGAASISHISSSVGGKVNLIFKNNNNTPDTIISGSNNIFQNPAAATAGFKRYLSNNNIALGGQFPQISGSMQFSPTINANYINGNVLMRGPVSASLMQVQNNILVGAVQLGTTAVLNAEKLTNSTNVGNNFIAGQLNIIANQSNIGNLTNITQNNINGTVALNLSSSALIFSSNTINDTGLVLTNQFSSGSLGFGQPVLNANTIGGTGNILIITGSQAVASAQQAAISQNLVIGTANTAFVNSSGARVSGTTIYHQLLATSLLGNRLIVTGSNAAGDTTSFGSAFVGRFNVSDGIKDKSSDIVFAVGTGTSTSARKTGFLIDSGSNTYVDGTFNLTGNQKITGSLTMSGSILFVDRSGYGDNVYLGTNALGMGSAGASPLAEGNTISVAIGNGAMRFASGSSQNVAIGNNALLNTIGGLNIAIGSEALTTNTTGNQNIAIGLNALNLNTTGTNNFAMGGNSMQYTSASTANYNVGIGGDTLTRNQTDSQIAIGANALQNVTTGNANTAIGRLALQNTTTGIDNVAIGTNALLSNITGERNIAIGKESLRNAAVNANYNLAIGNFTLYNAKSGDNVGIGHAVFENLQSGSDNVGIGYTTGNDMTNGFYNTLIGANLRGVSGWNNVVAISDGQANIKFFNSGSKTTLTNDTLISGSLTTTGSLTIQSGSSFFANGNKQFNVGAFLSLVTQSGSAATSQSMNFEVTDISEGVTMASNSRITLANSGTYNIQFSAQLLADAGADDVYIWLKKNGTNVPASAGRVTLANNEEIIATWNYVVNAAANDYYEIVWQATGGDALLLAEGASGNIPSLPSIILTVTQVR